MPEAHKYTKDEVWGMSERELVRHGVAFVNDILFGDTIAQYNKQHSKKKVEWYSSRYGQVLPEPTPTIEYDTYTNQYNLSATAQQQYQSAFNALQGQYVSTAYGDEAQPVMTWTIPASSVISGFAGTAGGGGTTNTANWLTYANATVASSLFGS